MQGAVVCVFATFRSEFDGHPRLRWAEPRGMIPATAGARLVAFDAGGKREY